MNEPVERIILFDGICNLCSFSVRTVMRFDRDKKFSFASLQSEAGGKLLMKAGILENKLSTIVYICNDRYYTSSAALLEIVKELQSPLKWLYIFRYIPKFIREAAYFSVAKIRYTLFGKRNQCFIPNANHKSRFL